MERNENMDWKKELEQLAPTLAALPKQNPFAVPENYFETLTEDIFAETTAVPAFPEAEAFKVPENYFDNLADEILGKVTNEQEQQQQLKKRKVVPISTFIKRAIAVAAVLAWAVVAFFIWQENQTVEQQLAQLSQEEIQAYLADRLELIDESLLTDQLDENDVQQLKEKKDLPEVVQPAVEEEDVQQQLQNLSEDDIEEYLLDNYDLNALEEAL